MPRSSSMIDDQMYLVTEQLTAVPIADLYSVRRGWADQPIPTGLPADGLPIAQDGALSPGQLYESSTDQSARFYLPRYAIHQADGRFQATLKWSGQAGDPGAPLAWLTIDLVAQAPAAGGFRLIEVEHQAIARLGYQMPVEGAAQAGAPVQSDQPTLWYELGALQPSAPNVRRCHMAIHSKQDFDRVFEIMTNRAFKGTLEVHCYATVGRRTWRQVRVRQRDWGLRVVGNRPIGRAVLTDEPATSEPAYAVFPAGVLSPGGAEPMTLGSPGMLGSLIKLEQSPQVVVATAPINVVARAPIVAQPIDVVVAEPLRRAPTATTTANLRRMFDESDLQVDTGAGGVAAIPVGAVVNDQGEPALVSVPMEAIQALSPFFFPIDTNGYMFDVPPDFRPTASRALLRLPFVANDGRGAIFFYDTGLDLFYYQPAEFRLSRLAHPLDQPNFQPYLIVTTMNVVADQPAGGEPTTTCRVNLTYRALPYIDPEILDLASDYFKETQVSSTPRFATLNPVKTALTLNLPSATPGSFTTAPRPDVAISFDEGLADNISLSDQEFLPIAGAFLAGLGVEGAVETQLLDRMATVRLRLSLNDTAGPLFAATYMGSANGRHQVRLTNQVESPVTIAKLGQVTVAPGVVALPQTAPGTTVDPGKSVVVEYGVTPADAYVRTIDPIVTGSVVLNYEQRKQLWRRLIVEQGYTTDTFQVTASIDPIFFDAAPEGMAPLTGVRIEFRGADATVDLTPAAPSQTITLRQGYLSRLLGEPRVYKYRVTNLHADQIGATGPWMDDEVDMLSVAPALPAQG
jgi:hypothetical protein